MSTTLYQAVQQTSLIGDRDRLGQIFTNLLSKAIKYSLDAQTIEMGLSASKDVITIRVCDHGLGIPQELRDRIFERLYRITDPKQKTIHGLGMELYIVAEIVKHHGGTITVDSAVGKGSTFTVTLPLMRDAITVDEGGVRVNCDGCSRAETTSAAIITDEIFADKRSNKNQSSKRVFV